MAWQNYWFLSPFLLIAGFSEVICEGIAAPFSGLAQRCAGMLCEHVAICQSCCGELLRPCPGKGSSAYFEFRRDNENVMRGISAAAPLVLKSQGDLP